MNESIESLRLGIAETLAEHRAEAAKAERAKIVEWLFKKAVYWEGTQLLVLAHDSAARSIERGEHCK